MSVEGLAGKDNLEKARVNMIADGLLDLGQKFTPIFAEKDEAKKVCIYFCCLLLQLC